MFFNISGMRVPIYAAYDDVRLAYEFFFFLKLLLSGQVAGLLMKSYSSNHYIRWCVITCSSQDICDL